MTRSTEALDLTVQCTRIRKGIWEGGSFLTVPISLPPTLGLG